MCVCRRGYRRVDFGVSTRERIEIPKSPSLVDEAAALVTVLGALIGDLSEVDARNAPGAGGLGQGVFAHIFFYEPAEAVTLQRAVGRHLGDERIRNGLLHLVRLFPPDDVVPEPEFRGLHHLPATAVRSVVEQLWALPVTVAYDLRQVSQALGSSGVRPASDGWEDRRGSLQVGVADRVFASDTFQDLMRRAGPGRWHLDRGFHDVNTAKTTNFLAYLRGGDA